MAVACVRIMECVQWIMVGEAKREIGCTRSVRNCSMSYQRVSAADDADAAMSRPYDIDWIIERSTDTQQLSRIQRYFDLCLSVQF